MADRQTKEQRSYTMSRIRKTDTKPELLVRKYLFKNGLRYRLYGKGLPGKPDIVMSRIKTVIFVNGCFWHAHEGCKLNRLPKSRQEYWMPKIKGNVDRDQQNRKKLADLGWTAITVWECELSKINYEQTLDKLVLQLKKKFKDI